MNSLFIYLFTETDGAGWFHRIAATFIVEPFNWASQITAEIITSLVVWGMLSYLCFWLYRKRILIKI
jgi:hypothetical protein